MTNIKLSIQNIYIRRIAEFLKEKDLKVPEYLVNEGSISQIVVP